ncbi:MAG: hypothetical protein PUJ06_11685 [Stecheria intestinalis]|nr:hypothetical protein [Stecheria intestinalis]
MKVDVAIQSYKKPESLIYTLFSLKKCCGNLIDTIYINDDCSGNGTIDYYLNPRLSDALAPIKLKVRENELASGFNVTLMTKESFSKKSFINKLQLLGYIPIHRLKFHKTSDDVRYQWAINNTDKKYLFIIHDDIKFFDNILKIYLDRITSNSKLAIVGDLGGERLCPFGPCGDKCSPKKILNGDYPCKTWPVTGTRSIFHTILGRKRRDCRINEWCCLINVDIAHEIYNKYGVFFGNYEAGGDVGTYWLDRALKCGYTFDDPVPDFEERKKWYLHWWQGFEGHEVWVDYGRGKQTYQGEMINQLTYKEFEYKVMK